MGCGSIGRLLQPSSRPTVVGSWRRAIAGLAPAPGHAGFDKVVVGENKAIDIHTYEHYLHHKYFECNYADGVIPLDKWFGTFHDGSREAQERMDERFLANARRQAEKRARREQRAGG